MTEAIYYSSVSNREGALVELSDEDLEDMVREPVVADINYRDFIGLTAKMKLPYKDVGGYLFATSSDGTRLRSSLLFRTAITIDIDQGKGLNMQMVSEAIKVRHYIHSTISSSAEEPRYRIIIPFSRPAEIQEFDKAVAGLFKKLEGIGVPIDSCSTVPTQIMFRPTVCRDKQEEYIYYIHAAEGLLKPEATYERVDSNEAILRKVREQQNPLNKRGYVGAFCQKYNIHQAITELLSDVYIEGSSHNSYTYTRGTTYDGVKTYENLFAYSHHNSDPAKLRLCHAFDLVRIHKFGSFDVAAKVPYGNPSAPSIALMCAYCNDVLRISPIGNQDYSFLADDSWTVDLTYTKGKLDNTAKNLKLIFNNDNNIHKAFGFNLFDGRMYLNRSTPWRTVPSATTIRDIDYAGVRQYLDLHYGLNASGKVDDAMHLSAWENQFHAVRDYLSRLEWDGTPRVETLLIDYMGTDDTPINRVVMRKFLLGAVNRVFNPGFKFDYALILVGLRQGEGKSSLCSLLGGPWFSDSFLSFSGKESFEQLQGSWIVEIAELSAMNKSEVESVKHYITKCSDKFRPAYGRVVEDFPRQCVFFGTTNDMEFLKDPTGNRRFWPTLCNVKNAKRSIWEAEFAKSIDQIWAEIMVYYKTGESCELPAELNKDMAAVQRSHMASDGRAGVIEEYLDKLIPDKYGNANMYDRGHMLREGYTGEGTIRQHVSVVEVWCECLGLDIKDLDTRKSREIAGIIRAIGWIPGKVRYINKYYGSQRTFERQLTEA